MTDRQMTPETLKIEAPILIDPATSRIFLIIPNGVVPLGNLMTGEVYLTRVCMADHEAEQVPVPDNLQVGWKLADPTFYNPSQFAMQAILLNWGVIMDQRPPRDQSLGDYVNAMTDAWIPPLAKSQKSLMEMTVAAAAVCLKFRKGDTSPVEMLKDVEGLVAMAIVMPEEVTGLTIDPTSVTDPQEGPSILIPKR